eukprot:CAMPEP_0194384880 /NCGR_PEP_ID=MMETSP0174-20130528/76728_1 /TAXON_ID=216777 /ORGANISM="Proboscia alata, Strain PI-D3" /LENGTH=127 /DNA_ID=CAMNT_0039172459 /DNA_START=201 /DNA_END=584 /DNA_ORIENTATION=+
MTGLLMKETYDFVIANNPYFLERPSWLMYATCVHSYVFWIFYTMVFVATAAGDNSYWYRYRFQLTLFLGAELYAILFYHLMEFTSNTPPPNLVPYFESEGPYLLAMLMVGYKLVTSREEVEEKPKTH